MWGDNPTVLYGPVTAAVILFQRPSCGPAQLAGLGVTIFLELFYILVLQRAYRAADLSLVYPIARGTAPVVATTGAVILFGERPAPVALAGAGLIIVGLLLVAGNPGRLLEPAAARGISYAQLVGFTIGSYTVPWLIIICFTPRGDPDDRPLPASSTHGS